MLDNDVRSKQISGNQVRKTRSINRLVLRSILRRISLLILFIVNSSRISLLMLFIVNTRRISLLILFIANGCGGIH